MHPENRFQAGDFVIHKGPSTRGDFSFADSINRVLEDTGEFITVEHWLPFCGMCQFVLDRDEYPHFRKATEIQIRAGWTENGKRVS